MELRRMKLVLSLTTAAVLAAVTALADAPRKKCIAFGWEFGFLTPDQILANAGKFSGTAIDGVGIYLMATNRAGQAIGSDLLRICCLTWI